MPIFAERPAMRYKIPGLRMSLLLWDSSHSWGATLKVVRYKIPSLVT